MIHKIRKGEELSQTEVDGIYSIFGEDFVYSIDELSSKTDIVGIIRKFVGVDEIEFREKYLKELGKEEGIKERVKDAAIKLLDILDDETIYEKTGLKLEEVKELRRLKR